MNKLISLAVTLAVAVLCSARFAAAQPVVEPANGPPQVATSAAFVLGPPKDDGPLVVRARFEVHEINEINEEKETFEFTGVLTLKWYDKRQAFDPAAAGVNEKFTRATISSTKYLRAGFRKLSSLTVPVRLNSKGSCSGRYRSVPRP